MYQRRDCAVLCVYQYRDISSSLVEYLLPLVEQMIAPYSTMEGVEAIEAQRSMHVALRDPPEHILIELVSIDQLLRGGGLTEIARQPSGFRIASFWPAFKFDSTIFLTCVQSRRGYAGGTWIACCWSFRTRQMGHGANPLTPRMLDIMHLNVDNLNYCGLCIKDKHLLFLVVCRQNQYHGV